MNSVGQPGTRFGLPCYFIRVAAEACVLAMDGATDPVERFPKMGRQKFRLAAQIQTERPGDPLNYPH
jgi:hypothetical protein